MLVFRHKVSYDIELKNKVKFALENEHDTTISQLSIRYGIPKSTLYDWKNEEIANRAFSIKEDIKYMENNNDPKAFKKPNTNKPNLFNPIRQLIDVIPDEITENKPLETKPEIKPIIDTELKAEVNCKTESNPKPVTKPKRLKTNIKPTDLDSTSPVNEINYDDQLILTELWEQYYSHIREAEMIKVKLIRKVYTTYGVKIDFKDI